MATHLDGKHAAKKMERRVIGVFDEAKHRLTGLTHEAQAKGEELIGQARDRGIGLLDEAQAGGEKAWKGAKGWIGREPVKAVGWAFVLGAVAAALWRRGDD